MEEAIKKIIEMVEAGKITAEDAERLIKAIKETGKKEKEYEPFNFRWIPEMVKRSVKDALHSAFIFSKKVKGEILTEIPFKETVKVVSYSGDIEIKPYEGENIRIEAEDAEMEESENKLVVISNYGDTEIFVPEKKPICMLLYNYNGDIEAKGNFKKLNIESYSGEIYVDAEFEEMNVNTYNGDCEIRTKRKPIIISISTYNGEIELPSGFRKEKNVYIYGEGEYKKINFESYNGDFELKFKEE